MNRFKKSWSDKKERIQGFAIGVATTSLATIYLIHRTKVGRQITNYEVVTTDQTDSPTGTILYVKHRDGEEGYYNIDD